MEHIFIPSTILHSLEPITHEHPRVCRYSVRGIPHILKRLDGSRAYNENTLYTVEQLNKFQELMPMEFCIPDFLVDTEFKVSAFTTKEELDSLNLHYILNSPHFTHQEKIEFLKKFGLLLRKCDELRKVREFKRFAICDIQEENILINPGRKELRVVDMDTCRIGKGESSQAKYLTPYSLAMYVPEKYRGTRGFGYVDADRDSDLFCYIIIILNYIAGGNIANIDIEEFESYIGYLEYLGFNKELLGIFYGIVRPGANTNPDYLLDSIDEKVLEKARYM